MIMESLQKRSATATWVWLFLMQAMGMAVQWQTSIFSITANVNGKQDS